MSVPSLVRRLAPAGASSDIGELLGADSGGGGGGSHVGQPSRAARTTALPELTEVAAQLDPGHGPVLADRVAHLVDVPLQLQFVLLEPRHVQLLP